jgi:hypothetical protein
MTARLRHILTLLALSFFCDAAKVANAQPAFPSPTPASPAQALATPKFPPLPPRSPVDMFRELLAQTPGEWNNDLTNRPPEIRKRIVAKLQEYQTMNPQEREMRLRMTQLRWYMLYFMVLPPSDRVSQLAHVSAADRQIVTERLKQWDRLPAEEKQAVLKYEKTMEQFTGRSLQGSEATNRVIAVVSQQERSGALKSLDAFLQLPPNQQQHIYVSFQQFFGLTDQQKQSSLDAFSASERAQMEQALSTFSVLPEAQREQCLRAFGEFSRMNTSKRQEFLKNAERWRELPQEERQAWRALVQRLTPMPPLPPGLGFPPLPPMPAPPLPPPLQVNVPGRNTNLAGQP